MTKTAIFENSRWRTAAILKIDLSPYLSRELSDFDQIWYTQMQISIPSMKIWQKKIEIFKFKMADGRHIENRFLAISRNHMGWFMQISESRWRITCRYRSRDQNGYFRKFKIANGRHFEERRNRAYLIEVFKMYKVYHCYHLTISSPPVLLLPQEGIPSRLRNIVVNLTSEGISFLRES